MNSLDKKVSLENISVSVGTGMKATIKVKPRPCVVTNEDFNLQTIAEKIRNNTSFKDVNIVIDCK
jgi:hypothetical protein